jgi:hypothetical protein
MMFNVADAATIEAGVARQELSIQFDQVIPKPFCAAGPGSFVYVNGIVEVVQTVRVTPSGNLLSRFRARGTLSLTPVNPATSPPTPLGEPYVAKIRENQRSIVTDRHSLVAHLQFQTELPGTGPDRGRLKSVLNVGPGHSSHSSLEITCDP